MSGSNPGFTNPSQPNATDYLTFVQGWGVTPTYLPTTSFWLSTTLSIAQEVVNMSLNCTNPIIYTLAVYNLAMDRLVNYAQDQAGMTYFSDLRERFKLTYAFAPGVVASTGDTGTSASYLNPEWMRSATIMDLENLKTPWGRQYMAFAQSYGSTIWGLS